jgi:UDP-GlcNAc:undecaprenyl-phosphate/decaprenyl-phosphate GlcNAc-1-phosphate transferase
MIYYIIFFLVAISCGVCVTWVVRYYAIKFNIVNKPNPIIPQHVKPIAYLGGVGIIAGIVIAAIYIFQFQNDLFKEFYNPIWPTFSIIIGSIGYLGWGTYDDLKQLKPLPKFIGQLILSIACVISGLQTSLFNLVFADFLFSVFWIVLVVNALNFTDVCDGLVGTICAITFLTAGILIPDIRLFCFLIAGVTLGFLFFNLPKASIFLGDAGSHLLGFLLAALGIFKSKFLSMPDAAAWLLLLPSVPLFELLFITTVRIYKGKPWWKGSPDHFSLRLQKAGLTRLQIDLLAGGISALMVVIACLFPLFDLRVKFTSLIFIIIFYAVAWKYLLRWEVQK